MIGELENVLYVQTDGVVLRLDHDNVVATMEKSELLRVPLHHLRSIVAIGRVSMTSPLLARCAEDGRSVAQLNGTGRFLYRLEGRRSGNVLLRSAQHRVLRQPEQMAGIVQAVIAGKLFNSRQVLLRSARDIQNESKEKKLRDIADELARDMRRLTKMNNIDEMRGIEGINAKRYFSVFSCHLKTNEETFDFTARSKRPPRDPINAVLSFLYSLLANDCVSALETVGLDPQVGFLHTLRPGRPSLALDLMEELRPIFVDRLAITLINRQQLRPDHFDMLPGAAVSLNEKGRKEAVRNYQERKRDECQHPLLQQRVTHAMIPLIQARILARAIRSDRVLYVPYMQK